MYQSVTFFSIGITDPVTAPPHPLLPLGPTAVAVFSKHFLLQRSLKLEQVLVLAIRWNSPLFGPFRLLLLLLAPADSAPTRL